MSQNNKHKSPIYWGYRGEWTNITICKSCDLHGLYEDYHPANPCPECGTRLSIVVGKWTLIKKGFLGLFGNEYLWEVKK